MNVKKGGRANYVPRFGILEATCLRLLLPPSCPFLAFLLYLLLLFEEEIITKWRRLNYPSSKGLTSH